MKLYKKAIMLSLAGLLAACSSVSHHAQRNDMNDGVQTSGYGDDDFGNGGGIHPCSMTVGNQVYYFEFDRSEASDHDRACIQVQAKYLANHPRAKVLLQGHTDPRGSREYNIALGERRALSVSSILKLNGAAQDQIRVVSYGAEKLASPGHQESDYQQDRRVVLIYEAK